jgi:uncharacterized protein
LVVCAGFALVDFEAGRENSSKIEDAVCLDVDVVPGGMMAFTHSESIEVKQIHGKGRGVFARRRIRKHEVIERVPVIVLPMEAIEDATPGPGLANYCFLWGRRSVALALGYGSLYNHSYKPNARYDDVGPRTKVFTALRDIAPGEEITINYNGEPVDRSSVGFDVIENGLAGKHASNNGKARRQSASRPLR